MAHAILFTPISMNRQQYDQVLRELERAGAGTPKGRLYHVCYGPTNKLRVLDVWDDMANFEAFGAVLMPILAKNGVDPGTPEIVDHQNTIPG
jgi:hypothetical protein